MDCQTVESVYVAVAHARAHWWLQTLLRRFRAPVDEARQSIEQHLAEGQPAGPQAARHNGVGCSGGRGGGSGYHGRDEGSLDSVPRALGGSVVPGHAKEYRAVQREVREEVPQEGEPATRWWGGSPWTRWDASSSGRGVAVVRRQRQSVVMRR